MCGLALHFNPHGPARALGLARLHHRGPDARGEWTSPDARLWLGHTRLAIVDLSERGAQPMRDERSGNVISFNGEIYNHLELRAELARAWPRWRGTSDTETLLAAYSAWGEPMLGRVRGMFALVIFNAAHGSIFIARDRLGMKPLYYTECADGWRFASETQLLHTAQSPEQSAVGRYLQNGSCPDEVLLAPGVRELPAGSRMHISSSGTAVVQAYWPARKSFRSAASEPAQRVRALLERSVREHLLADVSVACFLSGGIDSSILTALAARQLTRPLQTFAIGFAQTELDETKIAAEVAQRHGTQHTRVELSDAEARTLAVEAVTKLDLPSVDAVNTYIVCHAAAQRGIKVALSGLGGDELFGGYPSFRDVPRLQRLARTPLQLHRKLGFLGPRAARLADVPIGNATMLALWRRKFWTDAMLAEAGLPRAPLPNVEELDLPDDFARVSWAELRGYMKNMLLRDADAMSMAVSLELRLPFLDHELVEYVLGLPAAEKQRGDGVKPLLVASCADLLPPSVYERPKQGFGLPMDAWMRGPLRWFVTDGLVAAMTVLPDVLVQRLADEFERNQLHWTRLWQVVVLGHYLKRTARN